MPHPAGLPDLFIDRSLGRIQLPQLLRDAGLRLVTLAERYGIPSDEAVTDEQWLSNVGDRGEIAFMKDGRVRCFCLSRRDLTAEAMIRRFLQNLDRIADACSESGPFMYAVHENRIEQLDL